MKTTMIASMMLWSFASAAQEKTYDISKDKKNGELVFNGPLTFADLGGEPSFTWLKTGEDEYKPNEATIEKLKATLKYYQLVVFMGTWCEDSQYLVPKLLKVLHAIDYPVSTISMYGVDREKTTRGGEHKKYDITLVPTIILIKNGREIGRITESAQRSVEADLADIIK
jgi:thiol-disulfide isomerase/thioredoxin